MSDGQWIERATLENWADRDTEQKTRIRELEAEIEEAKAVAHGRGYQQGKAAGDAFGAAMREHVARLEAENKALREGRGINTEAHCAKCGAPRSNHTYRHLFQWPVLRRGALSEGEG